jgi:hypothetical protein
LWSGGGSVCGDRVRLGWHTSKLERRGGWRGCEESVCGCEEEGHRWTWTTWWWCKYSTTVLLQPPWASRVVSFNSGGAMSQGMAWGRDGIIYYIHTITTINEREIYSIKNKKYVREI